MGTATSHLAVVPGLTTCSCWEFLERFRGGEEQCREDFELTVAFLASVPLFAKQLPRSELPKVAQSLRRQVWKPGQKLVRQGEIGHAFFLIQSGQAAVATSTVFGEPERHRATLYPGDYFGGHTLMMERPNVATILAVGPDSLVTLSISKKTFQRSSLKWRLRFPKRPAVYEEDDDEGDFPLQEEHSPLEEAFICSAIQRNGNLRAFLSEASGEMLRAIAAGAERRRLPEGSVVARAGTIGEELFIVRSGSVQAVVPDMEDWSGNQSAETALAHSTMAERLLRKEHCLKEVFQSKSRDRFNTAPETPSSPMARSPSNGIQNAAKRRSRRFSLQPAPSHEAKAARRTSGRQPKQGVKVPSLELAQGADSFFEGVDNLPMTSMRSDVSSTTPRKRVSSGPGWAWKDAMVAKLSSRGAGGRRRSLGDVPRKLSSRLSLTAGESGADGRFVTFEEGESFGELSLMYNLKREANFVASSDTVIYAIKRRHFTTWFRGRSQRFLEYSKFLEEVYVLSQLLSSERWELACKAQGFVEFRPGERVIAQGMEPQGIKLWYLIYSGSAVVSKATEAASGALENTKLADLYRSGHFGERLLLRGDELPQVSVDAGPRGVCCLTFDGETILPILREIFQEADDSPAAEEDLTMDLEEWCPQKSNGWNRSVSWERVASPDSTCSAQSDSRRPERRTPKKSTSVSARHVRLADLAHVAVLGRGSFGKVILVDDQVTAKRFALKIVSKGHVQRKRAERHMKWERELLSMLDSAFIITMHKTFNDEQHVYFLLEAALGGSLLEVLHLHSEVLTEDRPHGYAAAFYVGCIALALEHMHERHIVHRDIKPDNVFLDSRGYAKVGDMGFARFVLGKTNTRVGTPEYMAPEMIDFPHTHDMSVDWWSLGVLTFELLAGQSPWEDDGISDPMERILVIRRSQRGGELRFPNHFPEDARNFVRSLLQPARARLGAKGGAAAVCAHEVFASAGVDLRLLASHRLRSPYLPQDTVPVMESEGSDNTPDLGDSIFSEFSEDGGDDPHWSHDF